MSELGQKIFNAVKNGKWDELVQLLSGGVDPAALRYEEKFVDVIVPYMMTALMLASYKGDTEMVNLLAKAGADVNQRGSDIYGYTALIWASYKGHIAAVQALLQWRAKIDQQSKYGFTALMEAARRGHVEIVRLLLDWGADKHIGDKSGLTAADLAYNEEIRAVINSHVFSGRTPNLPIPTPPAATSTTAKAKANTAEDAGANDPVLPSPAEVAAAECAGLQGECDTLGEQVAQVPARRDLIQRRDALLSQYNAARATKPVDYAHLSTLGESLEALKLESAKVTLSEEDHLTLATRHAALVKKVKAKCDALLEAEQPDLLASLAAKLIKLQELPVHKLDQVAKGAKPAAEAALKPHDPAKLQRLQTECTTFTQQLAHAPARRDLMQRRDELAARLKAAKSASNPDYILASKIMKEQQALEQESAQLSLSEKDYKTMGSRHAALVQQVQDMCEDLVAARQYRLLRDLAAQLTALRALDLSVLHDPSETDPVWVDEAASDPEHVARDPETTEKVDPSETDPVWVDEAAADPVHVAPGSETTEKSPAPSRSVPVDGEAVGDKVKESSKEDKEKCIVQ